MEKIKSIEVLFKKIEGTRTVFGEPWLGNIPFMGGKSIIFGPDSVGNYVYVFPMGGELNVSYTQGMNFIDEDRDMLIGKMQ